MTSTTATDAKIEALKNRLSHTPSFSSKSRRKDEDGSFYGSFVNNSFEVPDEVTPSSNSPPQPPPSVTAPAPTPPAFHSPMDSSRSSSTVARASAPRVALKTLPQPNASMNPVTSVASENKSQLTASNKITGKQTFNTKLDASSAPQKSLPTSSSRSDSVNNMSTNSTSTSSLVVYPNTTMTSTNGGTTSASTIKAVKAKPKPVSAPSKEQNNSTSAASSIMTNTEPAKEEKSGFGIDFDSLMSKYSAPATTKPTPKLPIMPGMDISQPSPTTIVKNVSRFEERNKLLSPLHAPSKVSFPISDKAKANETTEDVDDDLDDMLSKELEDIEAPSDTIQAEKTVVVSAQPQIELPKPSIDFDEEEESKQEDDDEDLLAQSLVNTKKPSSDKKESFKIPKKDTATSSKKEDKSSRRVEQVKNTDAKKKSKLSPPVEHVRERSSSPSVSRKRERSSDNDVIPEEKKRKTESNTKHSNLSSSLLNQDGPSLKREADRLFNAHNPDCLSYYIEAGLRFLDLNHYAPEKAINSFEQFKSYAIQVVGVTSKNFAGENIRLGILYVLHAYACKEIDKISRDRMQKVKAHLKNAVSQSSPTGNSTPNHVHGTVSVNSKDLGEFLDLQRNLVFFLDSLTKSAEYLEGLKSQSVIQKYMYKCTYTQLVNWVREVLAKV